MCVYIYKNKTKQKKLPFLIPASLLTPKQAAFNPQSCPDILNKFTVLFV